MDRSTGCMQRSVERAWVMRKGSWPYKAWAFTTGEDGEYLYLFVFSGEVWENDARKAIARAMLDNDWHFSFDGKIRPIFCNWVQFYDLVHVWFYDVVVSIERKDTYDLNRYRRYLVDTCSDDEQERRKAHEF